MVNLDEIQTADFTVTRKGAEPTFLPEPERRPRKYTVISVDDHIVEPPDMFVGRVPAVLADRAPRIVAHRRRRRDLGLRRHGRPNVGFNAASGRPVSQVQLGARCLPRDAPGGVGHRRTCPTTWISTGIYVSVNFPSFLAGLLRLPAAARSRRRPRPRRGAGVERLPPRGLGGHPPRTHHPLPAPVAARPRARGPEDPAQRRAGFRAVSLSPSRRTRWGLPSLYSDHRDLFFRCL